MKNRDHRRVGHRRGKKGEESKLVEEEKLKKQLELVEQQLR